MSRVDIIVPCYNYARFLRDCVQSVTTQSMQDFRVLIINDASQDETDQVANELVRQDNRVSYLRHERNCGHIATYNEGLDWASADYVILLSADDMLAPGALARAVRLMDTHEEVGLTHGGYLSLHSDELPDKYPLQEEKNDSYVVQSGTEFIKNACATGLNPVGTPTAIARTSLHKRVGGYRKELLHSGDMEMWLRLAAYESVGQIHAVQAIYRLHDRNMSLGYYSRTVQDYRHRKAAFDFFFDQHGDVVPGSREMRAQADRALAAQAFWTAVAQFSRGDKSSYPQLFEFCFDLCPGYRFWPPLAQLMRTPSVRRKAGIALQSLFGRIGGRLLGR